MPNICVRQQIQTNSKALRTSQCRKDKTNLLLRSLGMPLNSQSRKDRASIKFLLMNKINNSSLMSQMLNNSISSRKTYNQLTNHKLSSMLHQACKSSPMAPMNPVASKSPLMKRFKRIFGKHLGVSSKQVVILGVPRT